VDWLRRQPWPANEIVGLLLDLKVDFDSKKNTSKLYRMSGPEE